MTWIFRSKTGSRLCGIVELGGREPQDHWFRLHSKRESFDDLGGNPYLGSNLSVGKWSTGQLADVSALARILQYFHPFWFGSSNSIAKLTGKQNGP